MIFNTAPARTKDCYRKAYGPLAVALLIGCSLSVLLSGTAGAQSPAPKAVAASAPAHSDAWASLDAAHQKALAPLAGSWGSMGEGQRRKWIAIAKNYPTLSEADQKKMHSRMVDWANLSPADRQLARLNYAQTKSVPKEDRAANWEAYKALSDAEKQKLAAAATAKPVGAAVAPKPASSGKLAKVPVTRHTPEQQRNAVLKPAATLPEHAEPAVIAPTVTGQDAPLSEKP